MRIGSTGSSHHAGMSSIWHDPDFEPVREFQAPLVSKSFDDLPVPTEHHELPDGVTDPFAKLDAVYDVAALQMERGIKGAEFLNGKAPARIDAAFADADDVTLLQYRPEAALASPAKQQVQTLARETNEHHRRLDQAAVVATGQSSSNTAAAREAKSVANAGGVDGAALMFAPMVAGQLAAAAVPGPLPALAAQATSATQLATAVSAASEIAIAGGAVDVKLDGGAAEAPRRGLSKG